MAFITIDTDAISTTISVLKAISGEAEDHCRQQQQRADRTREALYALRSTNLAQLAIHEVEQFWHSLSFDSLASEFRWVSQQQSDLMCRVINTLTELSQQHTGQLGPRILELIDPLGGDFQQLIGPQDAVSDWLRPDNIWTLFDYPDYVLAPLDRMMPAFEALFHDLNLTDETLDRLRQHALLLIEDLERPLASYLNSERGRGAAELLNNFVTLVDDGAELLEDDSAIARILGHIDKIGVFALVGALLDYAADKDHSLHSLVSHLYGGGIEFVLSLNPVGFAVNTIVPLIGMGASVDAWGMHTLGAAQGGRWGNLVSKVGDQWQKTSDDADALSSVYKDIGSIVLDSHADVVGSGVLAPAVIAGDNAVGANPNRLGGDFTALGHDSLKLLSLPVDLVKARTATDVVLAGDGAHALAQGLPSGVRQPVDNAIYDVTSFAIKGLGL
ncbi:MAG TPA: hypothetical protein VFU60_10045 [Ktedonobacterales bacterium]|nr:hypothetical protein [Ktedonobacterales bacterium]